MKLLIKLAVAALLANAAFRIGSEYLTHIRFRDAVQSAATFRSTTNEDLRKRIGRLVAQYDLPQSMTETALSIERNERHVVVKGSYEKAIEVVPTYRYPWRFNWGVDVMMPVVLPYYPPDQ